jgi:hypothetical protein
MVDCLSGRNESLDWVCKRRDMKAKCRNTLGCDTEHQSARFEQHHRCSLHAEPMES